MEFYGEEVEDERAFKCIRCGEINLVAQAKQAMDEEETEQWNITSTLTAHRRFKEICSKNGMNFNDGLLYLLGLEVREEHGKLSNTDPFGVPSTKSLTK